MVPELTLRFCWRCLVELQPAEWHSDRPLQIAADYPEPPDDETCDVCPWKEELDDAD